jgi:hypothetical protein
VSLAKHSGADLEGFASHGLGRAAPAVHGGLDIEYGNATYHAERLPIETLVTRLRATQMGMDRDRLGRSGPAARGVSPA